LRVAGSLVGRESKTPPGPRVVLSGGEQTMTWKVQVWRGETSAMREYLYLFCLSFCRLDGAGCLKWFGEGGESNARG